MDGKTLAMIGIGIFCIPILFNLMKIYWGWLSYFQSVGMVVLIIGIAWVAYESRK